MINKVTPRSRNSAADKRYVTPDQYTDAVNIRVENSYSESGENSSGNVGVIKPVKGNTPTSGYSLSGHRVLGKVLDVPTDTIYFAAASSSASKNGVFKVDPKTSAISAVVTTSYFAWDGLSHVDMAIARSRGGDAIIYLTDGVNAPYKVDVAFFSQNSGISGERLYDSITVCPRTPNKPITGSFTFDPSSGSSNFRNLPGLQFAYQNVYETGEISALSSYSDVLVPPSYINQGAGTLETLDSFNRIDLTIPGQPYSVETVKLLLRFGDTGSWFVINETDRTEAERQGQLPIQKSFYNDEVLPQLPASESKRTFDSVPISAAANEVQEDRLFYGNYTEGRNNAPIGSTVGPTKANLSVIYEDRPDDFNPIALDIEPEVIALRRKDENGNDVGGNYCANRVAGFKVNIGSDPGAIVPEGSTIVFDFTAAPDKNFHIYESSHSFHANTELYDFDSLDSAHQNFNRNALDGDVVGSGDAKFNWDKATWGFSDQALRTGIYDNQQPANFRYGVSDEVITGNTATWEVRKGPLRGETFPVVYGSSPSTPLILRGGEISFSVKFRLVRDLTISDIVSNIIKYLNEDPTAGYIEEFNPVTQINEQVLVAQLLDSRIRGGYSIDMGAGTGRRRFSRSSAAADVVSCVGDRAWASAFESSSAPPSDAAPNPVGYFMVDKADVEFRLRDVTNLDNVSPLTSDDDTFYLALDITSVDNLNIVTMIPVLEVTTDGNTRVTVDPYVKPSRSKWDNYGEHEGTAIYGDGYNISGEFFAIHHGNVVNAWVSFGDDESWENPEVIDFNSLFDCLYEPTSGPAYKRIFEYEDQPASFQQGIEDYVIPGQPNYSPKYRNAMRWFGSLTLAAESSSGPSIGFGDTEGGSLDFVPSGNRKLIHTYQSALSRAIESGDFTSAPTVQTYANFAFSMLDGEGGIGGWKGSLLQNARIICDHLIYRNKLEDPGGWDNAASIEDIAFDTISDDQLQDTFARFTGKIEGSVPSSIMFEGELRPAIRFVADDRADYGSNASGYTGEWTGSKGFYPDIPVQESYGPALAGIYYPFQYLYLGGVSIDESSYGYEIGHRHYLSGANNQLTLQEEQIIETYIGDPVGGYWESTIPGYLKHNADAELDPRPSSLEMISDNTYILSSDQGAASSRSFKRSSNHSLGMVYYDYFGRPGTVIPFQSVYVAGYSDAELPAGNAGQGPTKIKLDFSLSNIPDWAHTYKFVYGGNSTTNDFIQYTAGGAFVAVNTEQTEEDQIGNIYVSLNYLQSNPDVSYAKAFGAVSELGDKDLYKFSGGDKLRVLSYFEGDDLETREFPVRYEFDVVDVTTLTGDPATNPLWNIEDGDEVPRYLQGQFVVVKNNPTASMFTYASVRNADNAVETTAHKWNNRAVIELYKPKSRREDEEIIYREIGDSYRIVRTPIEVGGSTIYQVNHEYSSHVISQGDVWFRRIAMNIAQYKNDRFKGIIRATNSSSPRFFDYYVESNRFTDQFADSKTIGSGKPMIYSPEARELNKPSSIIFSNINTRSSRYNRLSTFDATTANFKEIPNDHGAIKTMIKDGDSLAVFQESKFSMLPINRSVLSDASSNASLIASSKTIGNQVFMPGNFGVGENPESVLYVDGDIYFANPTRREVYRYSPGKGVQTISDAGMEDYFHNLFSSDPKTSKVVCAFDYKNEEFVIDYATPVSTISYSAADGRTYPELPVQEGIPGAQGTNERIFKRVPSVPSQPSQQSGGGGLVLSTNPTGRTNLKALSAPLRDKILNLISKIRPSYRKFNKNQRIFEARSKDLKSRLYK